MKILEVATNIWHEVTIEEIRPEDLKQLTVRRYFFNWKDIIGKAKIFKLRISLEDDIKGLMALIDFPAECRIEIKLLTASRENVVLKREKGKKRKEFAEIIGNLIAFAGKEAIFKYGKEACISLLPKTALQNHYVKKYGMRYAGQRLYLLYEQLNTLSKKYIYEQL